MDGQRLQNDTYARPNANLKMGELMLSSVIMTCTLRGDLGKREA